MIREGREKEGDHRDDDDEANGTEKKSKRRILQCPRNKSEEKGIMETVM